MRAPPARNQDCLIAMERCDRRRSDIREGSKKGTLRLPAEGPTHVGATGFEPATIKENDLTLSQVVRRDSCTAGEKSGRLDLNQRPLGPEPNGTPSECIDKSAVTSTPL